MVQWGAFGILLVGYILSSSGGGEVPYDACGSSGSGLAQGAPGGERSMCPLASFAGPGFTTFSSEEGFDMPHGRPSDAV